MRKLLTILYIALLGLGVSTTAYSAASMETIDLIHDSLNRPIKVNLWYPKGDCAEGQSTRCLADNAVTDRVIVFSHGSMGSANEYSWLLAPLAEQGSIIIAVSHFGESWVYGQNTIDPSTVMRFWQRPQDVREALDQLSQARLFDKPVNWNRIVAAGHSAGGQTAAALAGVRFDAGQARDYCQSDAASADRGCRYANKMGDRTPSEDFLKMFSASYKDERVKALVLLDPAIGSAATQESLSEISIPALIVGAKNNDFLPFEHHTKRYARFMQNATLVELDENEGHFVFVDVCDHDYKAQDVSLCVDRAGVDRVQVHKHVLDETMKFLKREK